MMNTFPMHSTTIKQPLPATAKYVSSSGRSYDFELQCRIGERLLRAAKVNQRMHLGTALAEHVTNRLDEIDSGLEFSLGFFREMDPMDWDYDAMLGFVQAPHAEGMSALIRRTAGELRGMAKPVNRAQLNFWRAAGEQLTKQDDDLEAFTMFADLEDAFEPIKALVIKLATDVDGEIQRQIDVARGSSPP